MAEDAKNDNGAEPVLTIAVAGATGNAGREIVRALASRGHRVRALVRDPDRLGALHDRCAEVRTVRVTERETLRGALDGADLAFSALGKTRQKDKTPRRAVDVDANLNLIDEARKAGVRRFGLLSVAFASLDHPVAMVRMKGEVEHAQLAVRALKPFSRNLYELGDFFVGTTAFGKARGNDGVVPSFGTHRLEDYFRDRYQAQKDTARGGS